MQFQAPDNFKKAVLPSLFGLYIIGTTAAFIFQARYFNDVLTRAFAAPAIPAQVSVNLEALNRVSQMIGIDPQTITMLTASTLITKTQSEARQTTPTAPLLSTTTATTSPPLIASSTQSTTTIKRP